MSASRQRQSVTGMCRGTIVVASLVTRVDLGGAVRSRSLMKMQQPPALEADGFCKFNRSYELNAGKHHLTFQARLLSMRSDRRAGLRPLEAAPRSAAAV